MTRYINRWTLLLAWAVLMGLLWALFVPSGVSVISFTLLALTGAVLTLAAAALWSNHQPTPSLRQTRAEVDAAEAGSRAQG